jgi:UDP-glucose:(heptosyl)LPS alpha-1,3-glucosyltransferase
MNIAFCLFHYFPYGGLQRDFIRIARTVRDRGHEVHVYTMHWEGDVEPGLHIHFLPAQGRQNHVRNHFFAEHLKAALKQQHHDVVMGFNKMPHLDVYYAADVCYQSRAREKHSWLYRLFPRYRQLQALEQAVFEAGKSTEILLISKPQQKEFTQYYQTEENRFHLMPPGISKDRIAPSNAADIRAALRAEYQLSENDILLLMVGSGFKTKGLDRAIRGLAALPEFLRERTQLFVIGEDKPNVFQKLANKLKLRDHVKFLGGRPDVPNFLLAADLLVHPAYHENTGTVLLEAVVAGLPVLTVEVCGYAPYIREANAGVVLPLPFEQAAFNSTLQDMLSTADREEWKRNGIAFSKTADIYHLTDKVADFIEQVGRQRVSA